MPVNQPETNRTPRPLTRNALKKIAEESLQAIEAGSYTLQSQPQVALGAEARSLDTFNLRESVGKLKEQTTYYGPDSELASWLESKPRPSKDLGTCRIWAVEMSTLETAKWLVDELARTGVTAATTTTTTTTGAPTSAAAVGSASEGRPRTHAVGVLNFASAKKPGGGFLNGSQAQEESIARSSTLYPSLMSPTGQQFYTYNHRIMSGGNDGYYSHAMIYSPSVLVFRDDNGGWVRPYEMDVLTSPAVNAGVVRQKQREALGVQKAMEAELETEESIRVVMKERMARLLYLFEIQGVRNLVLGSFGTGVFKNKVEMVVELWQELLVGGEARFSGSFERVVFGVIGHGTYLQFAEKFGTEGRSA